MPARLLSWLRSCLASLQGSPSIAIPSPQPSEQAGTSPPPSVDSLPAGSETGEEAGGGVFGPEDADVDTESLPVVVDESSSSGPIYGAPIYRADLPEGWTDPYSGRANRIPVAGSGYTRDHHTGHAGRWAVDFGVPEGLRVRAVDDGEVTRVTALDDPWNGGGVWYRPDNGPVVEMIDIHLSQVLVSKGQRVTRGQVIGFSGNTGKSEGPHIHHEIDPGEGVPRVDPLDPSLFDWSGAGWEWP